MSKQKIPTLVGVSGYVNGEQFPLQYGKTLVVGRSRSADFSLRRLRAYTERDVSAEEEDEEYLTVSGRHFEITMFNLGAIEVKNLSGNGTLVDGEPIDTLVIDDVTEKTHQVEFGVNEKFILRLVEHEVDADGQPKPKSAAVGGGGEIEVEEPGTAPHEDGQDADEGEDEEEESSDPDDDDMDDDAEAEAEAEA